MRFVFEDHVLDVPRRELRRGERRIALEPQVFDLLVYLVANRNRVVSKEDLLNAVWAGRTVSESTLGSRLNAARKAVGDNGEAQRLIRTLPRKGFRFVAAVREEPDGAAPPASAIPVIAAAPSTDPARPALALPDKPSIAVLPFTNMSRDPEQEYFADGITEDIITALSKWRWFFVIARNSTFRYKGRPVEITQIGRELGVRYVLEGSVRRAGARVRITGQLIEAATGTHIWGDRYDSALEDIFDLQDRVTENIVGAIQPRMQIAELQRTRQKRPETLAAYDYYLQALPHFYAITKDDNDEARRLFSLATASDPNYALAYALAASCMLKRRQQGWSRSFAEDGDEGVRLAEEALARDPDDPSILWTAGHIVTMIARDLKRGRALIDRSLALNPNCAQAWCMSGCNHNHAGNGEAGLADLQRALRLSPFDPMSHDIFLGISVAYLNLEQYDEMIGWAEKAVQEKPKSSSNWRFLAVALAYGGRRNEARDAIQRLRELEPGQTLSSLVSKARLTPLEDPLTRRFLGGLRLAGLPEQ